MLRYPQIAHTIFLQIVIRISKTWRHAASGLVLFIHNYAAIQSGRGQFNERHWSRTNPRRICWVCCMSDSLHTPRFVDAILAWRMTWPLARLALVSAYLIGGVTKLLDFSGAIAEQQQFGLHPGWLWAAFAIVVEIGGSALVVAGRAVWLGAGSLGVLTFIAMLVANDFWNMDGPAHFAAVNSFFEHLGLIAGLVLASILSSKQLSRSEWWRMCTDVVDA